jgi:sugar transferase (PEP-CTERM/EpsH1 system associated)
VKLLWVKAGGLVPPDTGGKIRSYHILKELAKNHDVTVFSFHIAHADDRHSELKELFHNVVCVPLEVPAGRGIRQLGNYLRHLASGLPFTVSKYCTPQVKRELELLLEKETYDILICDFAFTAGAIPWQASCPKIVFTHNVEAQIWKRHFDVAQNPLWKVVAGLEYRRTSRFERECLEKADHVLTVSEQDRDFFAQFIAPEKITAISTGVDTDFFRPSADFEQPHSLIFTGSMDWMPNQDAIFYFGREILPRVRAELADLSVHVVGRSPSTRLRSFGERIGMVITGRVDDIRPYVQRAAVYIVPLRVGGGTRLKIFEAMAMGKAVVSTSIGAEGLPVTHGVDILLADTAEDFAQAVLQLLRSNEERKRLGAAARALVEKKYGWASVAAEVEAVLRRVTAAEGRESAHHRS